MVRRKVSVRRMRAGLGGVEIEQWVGRRVRGLTCWKRQKLVVKQGAAKSAYL